MPPSSDSSRINSLVDLPGLIQSISNQRRSGELRVSAQGEERCLRFVGGAIVAVTGMRPDVFARALCWAGISNREQLHTVSATLAKGSGPQDLLRALIDQGLVAIEGALDAIDLMVEEEFTSLLTWTNPQLDFADRVRPDPWADAQVALGVSISANAVLL
jgi:Domain of unknown function (DUF4388)